MILTTSRSLTLALSLGVFGAAVLVLSFAFFTPGKYILIPWAGIVIAATMLIRAERIRSFSERFVVGLTAFMVPSLSLYVLVAITSGGPVGLLGHAWRIAFLLGVGTAINLPAARIAESHGTLQGA